MEIMPSEYQQQELSRYEKLFVHYVEACEDFGYLLLNTNAAMIQGEKQHIVVEAEGILMMKFFDTFSDSSMFETVMKVYYTGVFVGTFDTVKAKLMSNKALVGLDGKLTIGFNYVCVFPNLDRPNNDFSDESFASFVEHNCVFKEEFSDFKKDVLKTVNKFIDYNKTLISQDAQLIDDKNINSVLQRIAPEYTTIRVGEIEDTITYKGVDNELLVVTEDDVAVRAFMLDKEQINIVNKISKGDQLILACAGSGKSVVLISKCFKAARMNPEKKFLLTCKSKQLQSLYTWYIDRAGLKERNVECITFHKLCKKLAANCGVYLNRDPESWPSIVIDKYNKGQIKDRYYGIFIDEVQLFDQEWYKLCFNLLENRESGDHIFVICGDKTQEIVKKQKRGTAPWNAGENYPNYRGGNKSIRIEKNYRNCVEVNDYINRYVSYAKKIYGLLPGNESVDPDMFLRGKAIRNGVGTYLKKIQEYTSRSEAKTVMEAIHEAHDHHRIAYDEIAVVMYNKTYAKRMPNWKDYAYNLERFLLIEMVEEHMPHSIMYASQNQDPVRYGANDGVAMISFESVLGLDFKAVIVCGLKPFGDYDKTKFLNEDELKNITDDEVIENIRNNVRMLYVACTRARDILYIIQPERREDSLYMRMLLDAIGGSEDE